LTAPRQLCRRCGVQVNPLAQQADGCPFCRRHPLRVTATVTLGPYAGPLRTAIVRMKRPSEQCLTHAIGCLLAQRATATGVRVDLVLSVPTHWTKRLLRGVTAASQLAESMAGACEVPWNPRCLQLVRRTQKQSLMELPDRRRNVAGAFRVRVRGRGELRRKTVAVVDDIMTTGSTLNEITSCLRRAGAAAVVAVVAARAMRSSTPR
ncbi:MAG: phosphoribosyltransferase family protein, partial [Planctomycetota bacterium]